MMDMDTISFDERIKYEDIDEEAKLAVKRLGVVKYSLEHFKTLEEFDNEEMKFYNLCDEWWQKLTKLQRIVLFLHIHQNFSFKEISDHLNKAKTSVYESYQLACNKSKALFSKR